MLRWAEGPAGQHIELGISRDEPVPAARPARPGLGPVRTSRCCRWARSTTRSSARAGRVHLRGLLRAPGSSSPAPRRASPWPPRAARTSRRSPRRSGWSCPASTFVEPAYATAAGLAAVRRAGPDRRRASPTADRPAPGRERRLLLPAHHPADRPGAVRRRAGPARRRRAAPAGAGRRLPAGRRVGAWPDGAPWCTWRPRRGAARDAGRRRRAGRRGHRRPRRRRHLAGPAATRPGSGPCGRASAPRPRPSHPRRAAGRLPRPGRRS